MSLNNLAYRHEKLNEADNIELQGKYLTFWTDNQLFAVPICYVEQIVQIQQITQIPEFPAYARGVINLRGMMIPVVDLRARLGKQEVEYNPHTCIVVLSQGEKLSGLIVDGVDEVAEIEDGDISPPPELGKDGMLNFLQGIAKTAQGVVLLLALEQVLGTAVEPCFNESIFLQD